MPKSLTALLILTLLPLFAKTQADPREQLNIVGSPTVYDSVVASWRTDNINETFGDYLRDYIELDTTRYLPAVSTVTDNVCRTRLKNMVSPIYLPYNDIVKKHIVAYATTHKSVTRRMLSYGNYYFPMIEHELAKKRPAAGAEIRCGDRIGAESDGHVAERSGRPVAVHAANRSAVRTRDIFDGRRPARSGAGDGRRLSLYEGSLRYLPRLTLVMASYNYGPGNVNKALQRAGPTLRLTGTFILSCRKRLATMSRVRSARLSVLLSFRLRVVPFASPLPLATDTVMVRRIDLNRVSEKLNLPSELVKLLESAV